MTTTKYKILKRDQKLYKDGTEKKLTLNSVKMLMDDDIYSYYVDNESESTDSQDIYAVPGVFANNAISTNNTYDDEDFDFLFDSLEYHEFELNHYQVGRSLAYNVDTGGASQGKIGINSYVSYNYNLDSFIIHYDMINVISGNHQWITSKNILYAL